MLSLLALTTACATDDLGTSTSAATGGANVSYYELFGADNVIESVMVKDRTCGMLFRNVTDPDADTLAIWTVGVDSIKRDLAYPDADRPNFYAIFVPSNPTLNHTVAGFEQLDHYHVADRASQSATDDLFDAFIVNPGPNYNAATYKIAKSVKEMNVQIAAGILAAPVTTVDAGLGPVVFHAPIACGGNGLSDLQND
ncbi:MAG: hypothetical protein H0T79_19725 [Deltaproteobacteria bacterium]|nr:hypothetical protein [Deltaproteobacteria bacterium]